MARSEVGDSLESSSVAIVCDVRLYREGLTEVLKEDGRLQVEGVAEDVEGMRKILKACRPDAVLIDVGFPDALETTRLVGELYPEARVLALGLSETATKVLEVAGWGVAGYVTRSASVHELVKAVQSAVNNELQCTRRVASALLRQVGRLSAGGGGAVLTRRELEVVDLLDRGLTNKEIASDLSISLSTVKNHVHNILEKLHVHTRGEAAARVRRAPGRRGSQPRT